MSYPLITLPKGVTWKYRKSPKYSTIGQTPKSGRGQVRATLQQSPIFEWELEWNYLAVNGLSSANDFQLLFDFFLAMQGSFGGFVFDPSQYDFEQLAITQNLSGFNNGFSGEAPGMNYIPWSSDLTQSAWAKQNLTAALSGGSTQLSPTGSGAETYITVNGLAAGQYTFSVALEAASGSVTIPIKVTNVGGGTIYGTTNCSVITSSTIFSITVTIPAGNVQCVIGPWNTTVVYAADAQLETGSAANAPLVTDGTAVPGQTAFQLWRGSAPIGGSNYLLETIQNVSLLTGIYVGGTLVSGSTYTQTNFPAVVTFNLAPPAGSTIIWAGAFNYVAHFAEDTNDFEEFLFQLWDLKTLKLESVQL